VGLLCTKESPEGRPTMMDIVGTLQSIKDTFLGIVGNPKFQSDITHLLGSTSTTHNNPFMHGINQHELLLHDKTNELLLHDKELVLSFLHAKIHHMLRPLLLHTWKHLLISKELVLSFLHAKIHPMLQPLLLHTWKQLLISKN
jgi:hypothetical protein